MLKWMSIAVVALICLVATLLLNRTKTNQVRESSPVLPVAETTSVSKEPVPPTLKSAEKAQPPLATDEMTPTPSILPEPEPEPEPEMILNPSVSGEQRRRALFDLTQAGPSAFPALRRVLLAPIPTNALKQEFEVNLRITALEAIDGLAERGLDVRDAFSKSYEVHSDPSLKTLSMAGMSGIDEGRPGKARRLIQQMTQTER
jgi:hypothetical protein